MKILILTNLFSPDSLGGAERIAELQAEGLRQAGHEVVVVTSGRSDESKENKDYKIIKYLPMNLFWYRSIQKHPFFIRAIWHFIDAVNPFARTRVKKILAEEKPDLIISHNLKGMGLQAARALAGNREKWLHVVHDIQLSVPSGLLRRGEEKKSAGSLVGRYWESFCRKLFDSPRWVIFPSSWLKDFYSQRGFFKNSKLIVLPNPVVLAGSRRRERADGLKMLYIGQIEEHKGVDWLARHIGDLFGDWELNIVGAGSISKKIQEIAETNKKINFLGRKNRDEINEILSETDLTIVPSLVYENSPAVIYESLGAGVPVLAARIGGVGELIEEGVNGWTFEPANSGELLDLLKQAVENPDKLRAMAEACRKSVEDYQLGSYVERLGEIVGY